MKIGFPTSFAKFFIIGMGLGFGFATATVIAVSVSTTFSKGGLLTAEAMNILKSAVESIPDWTKGEKAGDAVYTAGNVGIGKTTPAGKLDVSGDICISGDCVSSWQSVVNSFPDWTKGEKAGDAVYTAGNVGIGKTTPAGKLDVSGDICISGNCVSSWQSVALHQYKKDNRPTTTYIYDGNGFNADAIGSSQDTNEKSHELSVEGPIKANFVEIYISYYAKSQTRCTTSSKQKCSFLFSNVKSSAGSSIQVEVRKKGGDSWSKIMEKKPVAVSDPSLAGSYIDTSGTSSTLILFHELTPNQKTDGFDLKITGYADGEGVFQNPDHLVRSSINNIQTVLKLSN